MPLLFFSPTGRIEQKLDLDGRFQLRLRADATGIKGYPALVALSPRIMAYPFLLAAATVGEAGQEQGRVLATHCSFTP